MVQDLLMLALVRRLLMGGSTRRMRLILLPRNKFTELVSMGKSFWVGV